MTRAERLKNRIHKNKPWRRVLFAKARGLLPQKPVAKKKAPTKKESSNA